MSDPAAIDVLYALTKRDDLSSLLADVLIAIAVVRIDEPSPHEVAREAARAFGWSEEMWREEILPHLREELALAHGHDLARLDTENQSRLAMDATAALRAAEADRDRLAAALRDARQFIQDARLLLGIALGNSLGARADALYGEIADALAAVAEESG